MSVKISAGTLLALVHQDVCFYGKQCRYSISFGTSRCLVSVKISADTLLALVHQDVGFYENQFSYSISFDKSR